MITFLHPSIDPVIVSFGQLSIRWYGLSYVVGLVLGIILIKKINNKILKPVNNKLIDDFFIWGTLGVIIGGRLGYILFYQTITIFDNPLYIFYVWKGGMSFHGGLIGIIIASALFSYYKRINFLYLSDLISTVAPIGLFLGRIANFINVELYGRVTSFPIAIIYPTIDLQRRHPSQIYEALLEGILIFLVLILILNKTIYKNRLGINTSIFLVMYGLFRILIENLREPDSHIGMIFNYFTMGQLLSFPMIILGILIMIIRKNESN